jgi:hypothetical protein
MNKEMSKWFDDIDHILSEECAWDPEEIEAVQEMFEEHLAGADWTDVDEWLVEAWEQRLTGQAFIDHYHRAIGEDD